MLSFILITLSLRGNRKITKNLREKTRFQAIIVYQLEQDCKNRLDSPSSLGRKLDNLRTQQILKVFIVKLNQFRMRARIECNLLITRKGLINIDSHIIQVPERRHGPCLTFGKHLNELIFRSQNHILIHCTVEQGISLYS
ncbi:hypothetical protein ES703_125990 [subsurface metagenome]